GCPRETTIASLGSTNGAPGYRACGRRAWTMADRTRQTYRLAFTDDGAGVGKIIEFEAFDAAKALEIARQERDGRLAELWQGKDLLCLLWRDRSNIWKVLVPSQEAVALSSVTDSPGTHCQCG